MKFWHWLIKGVDGGKRGLYLVLNRWLLLHFSIGGLLSYLIDDSMQTVSGRVILPLTGVLIGLCFAWAGNAVTLLQAVEIHNLAKIRSKGFEDYVYSYQLSILVILITLGSWGLAAFGVYTSKNGILVSPCVYQVARSIGRIFLCTLLPVTIRECWGIVKFAQAKLLAQFQMRELQDDATNN